MSAATTRADLECATCGFRNDDQHTAAECELLRELRNGPGLRLEDFEEVTAIIRDAPSCGHATLALAASGWLRR